MPQSGRSVTRTLAGVRGMRGSALVELALAMPLLMILVFGVVDFGQAINARMILTNVCREGGSIGCRQDPLPTTLPDLLISSAAPLALGGADGRVIVTRITSGTSASSPNPRITAQYQRGSLAVTGSATPGASQLGLSGPVYAHLVYDPDQGVADLTSVTVVEVWFKYRPITPLSNFLPGLLTPDDGGMIMHSRSVF
jgi:Flp pilus assembly protein TadG